MSLLVLQSSEKGSYCRCVSSCFLNSILSFVHCVLSLFCPVLLSIRYIIFVKNSVTFLCEEGEDVIGLVDKSCK